MFEMPYYRVYLDKVVKRFVYKQIKQVSDMIYSDMQLAPVEQFKTRNEAKAYVIERNGLTQ